MKNLNVNNIIIYAEHFSEMPLQSNIFEKVIAIFATPPNSYSGVSDPIDLICSRGGDLSMLEVISEIYCFFTFQKLYFLTNYV